MSNRSRILVLGATGVFGARLARRLARLAGLELILASRTERRAEALAETVGRDRCAARLSTAGLDIRTGLEEALARLEPGVVVHAAGPFQGQGYDVAKAVIAAGAHYLDLADGRDYVRGFRVLNDWARRRGVAAISGASTVPALSSAVVAELAKPFAALDGIDIAISPGNRTPRGPAVVQAILSYCGEPVPILERGERRFVAGWTRHRRVAIAGLGRRWVADCDVPDLDLFPDAYPDLRHLRFRAGLELPPLHFGLSALAHLRRAKLLPPLAGLAPALTRIADLFQPLGSDDGGMKVEVTGRGRDGSRRRREWHLVAHRGHGPFVPVIPAVILLRKLLAGSIEVGAHRAFQLFALDDFLAEATDLDIRTRTIDS